MSKTILITGASSGIGRAAAELFGSQGWNVIATMRASQKAVDLAQQKQVLVTRLDVQDHTSILQAVQEGIARFGKIDVLANNAGFGLSGAFEAIPTDKIREQFEVNVFGAMDVTRALLPHFRANQAGRIINVSSRAGQVGLPLLTPYCASKFALEGFSESLAFELAALNIQVKLVVPRGGMATQFGSRTAKESAFNASVPDYDAFAARVAKANAVFAKQRESRQASAVDVAKTILEAATDSTTRFRYFVGEDIPPFIQAKKEKGDQDYMDFMQAQFR